MTDPPIPSDNLLTSPILGNTPLEWTIALAVAVGAFLALRLAVTIVRAWGERIGRRLPRTAGRLVARLTKKISTLALLGLAVYLGSRWLTLSGGPERALRIVVVIAASVQAALWGKEVVECLIDGFMERRQAAAGEKDPTLATSMGVVKWIAMTALFAVIIMIALENLGIDITALIAGLGIGGIAVALAAQNILGDLFSSLSIVLDKPFEVGDFIIVGEQLGTVEYVGLKTTRVRSLSGEQLVFTNTDLLTSRIRNFKRMAQRRVVFSFGVLYQTTPEQLEEIPRIVRSAIESLEKARYDRCHFFKFGDSSLDFEAVYHVMSADYNVYMDVQQAINLTMVRRFADAGIDFAYPTRTLFIERSDDEEESIGDAGERARSGELAGRARGDDEAGA